MAREPSLHAAFPRLDQLQHLSEVELLRTAWSQGRPIAFDDRENEDVHSDMDFETLRDFLPFRQLMQTD